MDGIGEGIGGGGCCSLARSLAVDRGAVAVFAGGDHRCRRSWC